MIAAADNVDYGNGVYAARDHSDFFTKNAQYQKNNDYLNYCHIQPAIADRPCHTRAANEGAD